MSTFFPWKMQHCMPACQLMCSAIRWMRQLILMTLNDPETEWSRVKSYKSVKDHVVKSFHKGRVIINIQPLSQNCLYSRKWAVIIHPNHHQQMFFYLLIPAIPNCFFQKDLDVIWENILWITCMMLIVITFRCFSPYMSENVFLSSIASCLFCQPFLMINRHPFLIRSCRFASNYVELCLL